MNECENFIFFVAVISCLQLILPSVPVQLQVRGIQEVCWDTQRCECAGGAWWHGEVQPFHVVQAGVRQTDVERGGRGGVTEGQVRCVHGRVRLLLHQLGLQLVYQAPCAWV